MAPAYPPYIYPKRVNSPFCLGSEKCASIQRLINEEI